MRSFLIALIAFTISACGSKGGGGSPAPVPGKRDGGILPRPVIPNWGELSCQKEKRCKNMVLNLDYPEVTNFFFVTANIQLKNGSDEFKMYQCARSLNAEWEKFFGPGFGSEVDEFLLQIIDPIGCRATSNYLKKIDQYFRSTGEYKDEIERNKRGTGAR